MEIIDILYLSLAVGFVILVVSFSLLVKKIIETLEVLKRLLLGIEQASQNINGVKNALQYGGLSILSKLTGLISKRF